MNWGAKNFAPTANPDCDEKRSEVGPLTWVQHGDARAASLPHRERQRAGPTVFGCRRSGLSRVRLADARGEEVATARAYRSGYHDHVAFVSEPSTDRRSNT